MVAAGPGEHLARVPDHRELDGGATRFQLGAAAHVVDLGARLLGSGTQGSPHDWRGRDIAIFFPNSYNESRRITDLLRSNRAVLLNVSEIEPGVGRRLVDFAAGTAYALNAKIEVLVNGTVYLVSPQGTHISPDTKDRLRASNYRSLDKE